MLPPSQSFDSLGRPIPASYPMIVRIGDAHVVLPITHIPTGLKRLDDHRASVPAKQYKAILAPSPTHPRPPESTPLLDQPHGSPVKRYRRRACHHRHIQTPLGPATATSMASLSSPLYRALPMPATARSLPFASHHTSTVVSLTSHVYPFLPIEGQGSLFIE